MRTRTLLPLNPERARGFSLAPFIVTPEKKSGGRPVILLPNPFYQCYAAAALAAGAEAVFVHANAGTGFLPDYAALPKSVLERTVAAYICSPSNPEGAAANQSYWRNLFALADKYDFTVFADECYADIYLGHEPLSALTARHAMGGDLSRLLTFHSLSKRSCLPGLRSGIVAGDEKLIATFQTVPAITPARSSPCRYRPRARRAWRDEEHVKRTNRAIFAERFHAARDILEQSKCICRTAACSSGWTSATARTRRSNSGAKAASGCCPAPIWAAKRNPEELQSNPGFPYIRVALVSDLSTIKAAVARMGEILSGGH